MVSLWPFGGQNNSPDAFEKKLSAFAIQIIDHEKRLNLLRNRGRRLKALWTLYSIIAWVVYATILVLVVGLEHANMYQIAGLGLSPFVVYVVRQIIKRYYEWRVNNIETSLESLREQQTETIEKLKAATKYDSTQALLDKYTKTATTTGAQAQAHQNNIQGNKELTPSGPGSQPVTPAGSLRKRKPTSSTRPPVANILPGQPLQTPPPPGPERELGPQDHIEGLPPGIPPHMLHGMPPPGMGMPPMGQFAPPPPEEPRQPQWYDRFLDVLLGEDETSAKNRFALICSNCRQVNGLAPPGTTNVEDVRYICGRCGAENGKPEVKDLLGRIAQDQVDAGESVRQANKPKPKRKDGRRKADKVLYKREEEEEDDEDIDEDGQSAPGDLVGEEAESSGSSSEETVVVKKKKKGRPTRRK